MQSTPVPAEHLGHSSPILRFKCPVHPTALLKRISNGEIIEQLQCLGGDRLTSTPVLQVGDAREEDNKDRSEGLARLPLCCAADSSSSKVTQHHQLHPPPKPQTSQATKYWYKITVLTFG